MKNLLLSCALLLALLLPLRSLAAGPPLVAVVRIIDNVGVITAFVARTDAPMERLTFASGISDKHLVESTVGYQKLVQRLYTEGYTLQSTFSNSNIYTTLIFVKPS